MKLSMYKELLATNPKLAMLFDLSERFPRGPEANLRSHHYEGSHGSYYQRHETQLDANAIRGDKKMLAFTKHAQSKITGSAQLAMVTMS